MRLLILNGPNLDMLGIRDKKTYGTESYKDLIKKIKNTFEKSKTKFCFFQSNSEEKIINYIHKKRNKFDGVVVNLGAYTHYSYAIRDAIEMVDAPVAEVHISDINNREPFRKISVLEGVVKFKIVGKGTDGYLIAIKKLLEGGD